MVATFNMITKTKDRMKCGPCIRKHLKNHIVFQLNSDIRLNEYEVIFEDSSTKAYYSKLSTTLLLYLSK